jgi:hypothetical protein
MKRVWPVGLLFLSCLFLVGMGGLGGSGRISAPEPAKNFTATITDQSDISTVVERLSFDGQTAISGRLGKSRISIDFERIASIRFGLQGEVLEAEVSLKDGEKIPVSMEKGIACYGKLPYGELEIAVEDIRAITIHGQVAKGAAAGP